MNLAGGFLGDFFGPISLEKTGGKNPPKNPQQFQIRIWEFQGQNPHCKDPALSILGGGGWCARLRVTALDLDLAREPVLALRAPVGRSASSSPL